MYHQSTGSNVRNGQCIRRLESANLQGRSLIRTRPYLNFFFLVQFPRTILENFQWKFFEKFLGSFQDFLLFVKKRNRHGFVTLIFQVRSLQSSVMAGGQDESACVGMTTAPAAWAARRRRKMLIAGAESAKEGLQPSKWRRLRPLSSTSNRRRLCAKSARKRLQRAPWRAPWRAPNSPMAPSAASSSSIIPTQHLQPRKVPICLRSVFLELVSRVATQSYY